MSQLERVEEGKVRGNGKKSNGSGGKIHRTFISYNPTREEKQAISELPDTLEDMLDFMSTYWQDGYSLSWKYVTAEECYSLTLREKCQDWTQERALSCWHVDWLKCLRMMYHALHNRYALWPNLPYYSQQTDLEW